MLHTQVWCLLLHGGLLAVDLEGFENGGLVKVSHVIAAALHRPALIARFALLLVRRLLLLLRDEISRWAVVAPVHVHIEGEVERARLRHGLVVLPTGLLWAG